MAITRLGLGKNTMALYRRGFEGWAEFSAISSAAASLGGLSGNYSTEQRQRKYYLRWKGLSKMYWATKGLSEKLFGERVGGLLRRGLNYWQEYADANGRQVGLLESALESFEDNALRNTMLFWAISVKTSGEGLAKIKKAIGTHLHRKYHLGFDKMAAHAKEEKRKANAMRKSLMWFKNGLLVRVVKAWGTVVGKQARREDVMQKFVRRLLNRRLAMTWQYFVEFLEERRALKREIVNMAFRAEKGQLELRFRDWVQITHDNLKFAHLENTAVGHMIGQLSQSAVYYLRQWCKIAHTQVVMSMAMGKQTKGVVRTAFSAFVTHMHFVKFTIAVQRAEFEFQKMAFNEWSFMADIQKACESLTGETTTRSMRRCLREWRAMTAYHGQVDLKRRYLTSRVLFYQRQEIIQSWHMASTASRHARKLNLLHGVRQFNRRSRERYHKRLSLIHI